MSPSVEIQLIAIVVAATCALPGVFLVLRRMAMMSDAISHTVLLGIVLAFFVVEEFGHPLLMVGAAAIGLLTVTLVEMIAKTKLVKEDASIGIVFPALFSMAVILVSVFARNVHLDEHIVFQGDLAFAPFDRMVILGIDLGPRTLAIMAGVLLLNLLYIILFYKELNSNNDFEFIDGTYGQVWCLKIIDDTLFCGHNSGTFIVNDTNVELISTILGTWDIKPTKSENLLLQGK